LLFSMALTSFLTGITEPIEFTFMFVAPALYALHAILTGLSMVALDLLGVRHGFGFSAGLFDYVLNFNRATLPLLILPFGALYFAVYYFVFRWFIRRFNVLTPGRSEDGAVERAAPLESDAEALALAQALGGGANLLEIDACTTRLRLRIVDQDLVDEAALKSLGAAGVLRPTADTIQVVMGLRADEIAGNIRHAVGNTKTGIAARTETLGPVEPPENEIDLSVAPKLVAALGGAKNILKLEAYNTRLSMQLNDPSLVNEAELYSAGFRGLADLEDGKVQVLAFADVSALSEKIREDIR